MIEWEKETLEIFSEETGVSLEEAEKALDKATAKYSWIEYIGPEDYENFNLIWNEALRIVGK